MQQVGRELGVRYVLEGSVRKAASRLRITAQLIEAATGVTSGRTATTATSRTSSTFRTRSPRASSARSRPGWSRPRSSGRRRKPTGQPRRL